MIMSSGLVPARVRVALPEPWGDPTLRIASYGVREWMPSGCLDRPHGQEFHLVMVFNHEVNIGVADRVVEVPAGSFIVWQAWAPHFYGHPTRIWNHSWINVDGAAVNSWLAETGIPVDTPIQGVAPRLLERCVLGVHDELQVGPDADAVVVRNHLHTCFRQVARILRAGDVGVAPQLRLARAYLETRYAEPITLALLSRQVGWSVPHLSQRFRRAFGAAPIDYLIRIRLAQAHLLIRDRGLGVAAAAAAVGYADYHHFTKLYRRRYGHPPSRSLSELQRQRTYPKR